MYSVDDTIVAVASARGAAIRGVIRISGGDTAGCLEPCFRPDAPFPWQVLRQARSESGVMVLERAVGLLPARLYFWPTNRSYTRQPSAELHTIGSPPLLEAAVRTLCGHGARLAAPGEFTLRAFLAGRLDLTQAEAVLGVIDARDGAELDLALGQLAGGLGKPLSQLRDQLLELLAQLEAGLDFAEEEIEFIRTEELIEQLAAAAADVLQLVRQLSTRARSTDPVRVVLVGRPNVGKSSLFNALGGQSSAIVSAMAGTTRDYLLAPLGSDQVQLVDTAGVAALEQDTAASAAGQRMTRLQHERAQLSVLCLDSTQPVNNWELAQLAARDERCLVVMTKSDLAAAISPPAGAVVTSTRTGAGLAELRLRILSLIETHEPGWSGAVPSTTVRCHQSLQRTYQSLQNAISLAERETGEELVAVEIRAALDELGQVVGAIYTDDLLDRIFSRFCIGK